MNEPPKMFADVFRDGPNGELPYLDFLNLGDQRLAVLSIEILDRTLRSIANHGDRSDGIAQLLSSGNWRPQLVGGVALLLVGGGPVQMDALWAAFDAGSWVSPQLAVVAYLLDSGFAGKAKTRISTLLDLPSRPRPAQGRAPAPAAVTLEMADSIERMIASKMSGKGPSANGNDSLVAAAVRHSEQGPGGEDERNAKAVAALTALLQLIQQEGEWAQAQMESEKFTQLRIHNVDRGDLLATRWVENIRRVFQAGGFKIAAPS